MNQKIHTMESDLVRQSAATLASAIRQGDVTSEQVTAAHLDRIEQVDPSVHAFLYVNREQSLKRAREVDRGIAEGNISSPWQEYRLR